ncbi:hypothetical protein JYU34_010293 [Plutella xylostella]|uniref:Protein sleepless n=1 Tax=Plutella xylostella TaxID=51655 RepID=A0ABQ7QI52_PLUXY|nr:hypothetical protein JYU34_010293 [Plutella xylostella]
MEQKLLLIAVLFSFVYESSAIHCFYCNSANNSACADVMALEPELRARIIPAVHCETAVPTPATERFFCRKIVQTIFHSHRDSEVRVTRGCGWVRHHRECYKADNADHLETVCQCFEDHCNGSERVNAALAVAALCAFGRLLLS